MFEYYYNEDNSTVMTHNELYDYLKKEYSYKNWLDDYYERLDLVEMICDIINGETDKDDLIDFYESYIEEKISEYPEVTLSDEVIATIKRS